MIKLLDHLHGKQMVSKGVTYQESARGHLSGSCAVGNVMILTRVIIVTMLKIKMKTTSKKRKRRHNRRLT